MQRNRFSSDPPNQILILTNSRGKVRGFAPRELCHSGRGQTHWGLLAVLKRSDGRIIFARRSPKKSVFANVWDGTVATHVHPGETVEGAATRQTKKELGIDVAFSQIGSFFYQATDQDYSENEYCSILIGISDAVLHLKREEVSEVAEIHPQLVMPFFSSQTLSPWFSLAWEKFGRQIKTWRV